MGLILLERPGIQLVCGKVVDCQPDNGEVTIQNNWVYKEFDNRVESKKCTIHYDSGKVKKMNITKNSFLLATIHPTEATISLTDGIYDGINSYDVNAYHMRFSGAFDFEPRNGEEEAHVFCGTISNNEQLSNGGNLITLVWKKNGIEESRKLYSPIDIRNRLKGNKAVFVTGPVIKNGVYRIKTAAPAM